MTTTNTTASVTVKLTSMQIMKFAETRGFAFITADEDLFPKGVSQTSGSAYSIKAAVIAFAQDVLKAAAVTASVTEAKL
jgi:hypothetical protein